MKCVKGLGFLWVAVLAAFFALSACDDSSSASSDETGVSSSSVESSDSEESSSSVEKKSSGNETKDKSSSSENKSSSSTKETKNSSDSKSSSSVKSDDSSSSKKDTSSSSENSSSSKNQSSSSSVKQSSSSVASSSSEYIPYNHAGPLLADSLNSNAYQKFSDKRNGRSYYYLTINGKDGASVTVMAENLNIGEMVNGDKDQTNDTKIERYCYDNDTTKCDKYGGLYQWAEMMNLPFECNSKSCADSIKPNHQGICPDGWRLMTRHDFEVARSSTEYGVHGLRSEYNFTGNNESGLSLTGSGVYDHQKGFDDIDEAFYMYYPVEYLYHGSLRALSQCISRDSDMSGISGNPRLDALSVRCVKLK